MGAGKCPECGGLLSKSARRCPHCGRYIWTTGRKVLFIILLPVLLAFVFQFVICMNIFMPGKSGPGSAPTSKNGKICQ